ncbi:hypothetical protein [Vibrio sp. WXL103]|uniref:hypothetical protein n=1 Tax=unclassified Vibrio TaxID=2614977 RepID=UPI003EC8051C
MNKVSTLLAIAYLGAVLSPVALANQPPRQPPSFDELDANGDGQLSRDEVKGPLAEHFDSLDANGDGFLSQDELPEPRGMGKGDMKKEY